MLDRPAPGTFIHIEFASGKPQKTRKFLQEVFDWRFTSVPGMEFYPYSTPHGPGGAVVPPEQVRPEGVFVYILSEDLEKDSHRIETAGGKVLNQKRDVPRVGSWVLFKEPGGSVGALFQPDSRARAPLEEYDPTVSRPDRMGPI
jgi:predicted enzyme related to lactoylglutathione lyase